jgi:hypothetical protein
MAENKKTRMRHLPLFFMFLIMLLPVAWADQNSTKANQEHYQLLRNKLEALRKENRTDSKAYKVIANEVAKLESDFPYLAPNSPRGPRAGREDSIFRPAPQSEAERRAEQRQAAQNKERYRIRMKAGQFATAEVGGGNGLGKRVDEALNWVEQTFGFDNSQDPVELEKAVIKYIEKYRYAFSWARDLPSQGGLGLDNKYAMSKAMEVARSASSLEELEAEIARYRSDPIGNAHIGESRYSRERCAHEYMKLHRML